MWSWGRSELAGTLLCQQEGTASALAMEGRGVVLGKTLRPPAPTMEQQERRGAALPSRHGLLGAQQLLLSNQQSVFGSLGAYQSHQSN